MSIVVPASIIPFLRFMEVFSLLNNHGYFAHRKFRKKNIHMPIALELGNQQDNEMIYYLLFLCFFLYNICKYLSKHAYYFKVDE